jgi:hypothetical protein
MRHSTLAGPASAMAEVHMHYEHPFRYIYHTLRWLSDDQDKEDLGVEVMITAEDAAAGFRLPLPLLNMDGSTPLSLGSPIRCGCPSGSKAATPGCINTEHIHRVAFTVRWVGGPGCAHYNMSLALVTSLDGVTFDEEPAVVLSLAGTYPAPTASPCTPAKSSDNCTAAWNCASCRVGAALPADCLTCKPGYTFVVHSTDCTGDCVKGVPEQPPSAHERSTAAIATAGMAGRFLSVQASLSEHQATGEARAGSCALGNFSVIATLIADPTR